MSDEMERDRWVDFAEVGDPEFEKRIDEMAGKVETSTENLGICYEPDIERGYVRRAWIWWSGKHRRGLQTVDGYGPLKTLEFVNKAMDAVTEKASLIDSDVVTTGMCLSNPVKICATLLPTRSTSSDGS